MSRIRPPLLAVALLRRFVPDNEPLIGDLLERFAVRPSRLRFWREVLAAVAFHAFQQRDQDHPLGLASGPLPVERAQDAQLSRHVNLSASPLPHIGGVGLLAMGVLVSLVRPDVWWMAVPAALGGTALGVVMTLLRRRAVLAGPSGTRRVILSDRRGSDPAD